MYLLVSLFFVLGTKVEFALVLLVNRKMSFCKMHTKTVKVKRRSIANPKGPEGTRFNKTNDPETKVYKARNNLKRTQFLQSSLSPIITEQLKPSLVTENKTNKIDFAAFCIFFSSYIIFNCVYFITYI